MIYTITHKTQYRYWNDVALCHNVLRLHPRDTHRQTCTEHEIQVTPPPHARSDRHDFYGNFVTNLILQDPHRQLTITAHSQVRVEPQRSTELNQSMAWEEVVELLAGSREPAQISARQFVYDSTHVVRAPELADYAQPSFFPGRPLLEAVMDLTTRIHKEFKFVPGATDVGTSSLQVLKTREGVCQDFAHLQIGRLRSLGLPARYVSGYLATKPPPGRERLQGADVSHAWVGVFDPNIGWVDFDPTNGVMPSEQHVTLAWARDYEEISPVRGIVVGGARHGMHVEVDVIPQQESLGSSHVEAPTSLGSGIV